MNLYLIIALSIVFVSSGVPALCFYWQKRKKENKSQIKWAQKCYYFWRFVFSTKSISLIWGFFTKIISWLTNKIADILMSIAFLSVILLAFVCVKYYVNIENESIDLAILTVSFALAAIIPYIVGNSIARNEVAKIVDKKFEDLEKEYSISLFSLTKQNAHTKRMSANLLKCTDDLNKQKWAAGWAAEALISYCRISKKYDGEKYIIECIDIIKDLSPDNQSCSQEKSSIENINERTLRSLLTMHAYTLLKHQTLCDKILKECKLIEIESSLLNGFKEDLKTAEKSFDSRNFCSNCRISDLNDDSENAKISDKAKEILENLCFKKSSDETIAQ